MQLHLYVSDEVADALRRKADARGLPVSRYLAELVQRDTAVEWPRGYFDAVIGAWQGEALERDHEGVAEDRDPL